MPTYVYKATGEHHCDQCREGMEIFHRISEPNRTECPACGAPIAKTVCMPQVSMGRYEITDAKLNRSGLSKYKNLGDGRYEKIAGPSDAPKIIDKNSLPKG